MSISKQILRVTVEKLIDVYGLKELNEAISDIFTDRMNIAVEKGNETDEKLNDELAAFYDDINLKLSVRPYRDDIRIDKLNEQ